MCCSNCQSLSLCHVSLSLYQKNRSSRSLAVMFFFFLFFGAMFFVFFFSVFFFVVATLALSFCSQNHADTKDGAEDEAGTLPPLLTSRPDLAPRSAAALSATTTTAAPVCPPGSNGSTDASATLRPDTP